MACLQRNKIKYPLIAITILTTIIGTVYFVFFQAKGAEAEWFNDEWFYRKKVEITNAGTAQTDFQVMITLDTTALYSAGKIQSDCDDIRITDLTGKLLPHWLEPTTCNTASTKIWTKVPSIATTGVTIYIYYGNPSAASVSSTTNTFIREIFNVQAAWTMDEVSWNNNCSASTVTDSSNNANHGLSCPNGTGPTGGAAGKFGNAGLFDGEDDRVLVADSASLDIVNAITVEAWVYPTDTGSNRLVVSKCFYYGGYDESNYTIEWTVGRMYFLINPIDETNGAYSAVLSPNQWYHVVGTYDKQNVRIYVNGVQGTPLARTADIRTNNYNLAIGSRPQTAIYLFKGFIDDVRIYNKALSTAEISDLYGTGGDRQGYVTTNYANKELVRKYSASVSVGSAGTEEKGPGPVAYWRFDEGVGDTTYDDSVNNNDGTRGGGTADYKPTWQAEDMCVSGKCLRFDGTNDYVQVPNNNSLKFGTGDFSLEAWVKIPSGNQPSEWPMIICKDDELSPRSGYHLNIYQTSPIRAQFAIRNNDASASVSSIKTIDDNQWHHLVGVKISNTLTLYVDGTFDNSASHSIGSTDKDVDLMLSNMRAGGTQRFLKGSVDDVRIYNYARSAAQIKTDYLAGMRGGGEAAVTLGATNQKYLSDGLVGYWKMDESSWTNDCSTPTVTDSSGAGNNGISCPAGTGPTGAAAGKFGNAGSFDGVDEYVDAGNGASLNNLTEFTYETWIYRAGGESLNPTIIQKRYIELSINKTTGVITAIAPAATTNAESISVGTISANIWTHITTTYSDSGDRKTHIYINGTEASYSAQTAAVGTLTTDADYSLRIGANRFGGYLFKGSIDDVRIYNRALSPKEVRDLYNFAPGPVGYWKMDEKVSGNSQTIYDRSTYSNNGTTYWGGNASGMDCRVPGKYGSACQFDGTDDYVDAGSNGSLNIGIGDYTMEAWIKPAVDSEYHWVMGYTGAASNQNRCTLGVYSNNKLRGEIWDDSGHDASPQDSVVLTTNTWYHIALTLNRTTDLAKLYKNGVEVASVDMSSVGNIALGSSIFYIGRFKYAGEYFDGPIDEVRIYNYARTQKQILEDMNAGHPAVGSPVGSYAVYWNFDEGYSNIAHDASVNANNGTLQPGAGGGNTQAYQMWDNNGKFNKAIEFDGTDDYVNAGSSTSLNPTTAITLEAWIKRSVSGVDHSILDRGWGAAYLWRVKSNDQLQLRLTLGIAGYTDWSAGYIGSGAWYHVVSTFDSATGAAKSYINGNLQQTWTGYTGDSINTYSGPTYIGHINGSTEWFNGLIDEVKIYPFALTEDEIRTEYNKGAALKFGSVSTESSGIIASDAASRGYCVPGDTTSCNGPVGEWKFDEKVSGNGQTVYDTSGSGNNGTTYWGGNASGMDCTKLGKNGSACQFDGTDDYINVGDKDNLDGMTALTVEAWINPTLIGAHETLTIASKDNGGSDRAWSFGVDISGGGPVNSLHMRTWNSIGGERTATTAVSTIVGDVWQHVVGVLSTDDTMKLYINGIDMAITYTASNAIDNIRVTTAECHIGNLQMVINRYFNGFIDDARIYNYARTPAQIAWDYNRGGPVGYWEFDECQNNIAHDVSGNSNNGTITIGVTGTQDGIGTCTDGDTTNAWYNGRTGKYNSAMSFDGTDDYANASNGASLQITDDITMEAWIYPVGWGESNLGHIACKYTAYRMYISNTNNRLAFSLTGVTGTDWVSNNNSISLNQWQHVAATRKRNTGAINFYVNGVSAGSTTGGTEAIPTTANDLMIGQRGDSVRWFNGLIDEVKIYNYALTAKQIQTEYNQGAGIRFGPSSGTP